MEIEDDEATKPEGWLDDELEGIEDPEASKPEDWDDKEDGEWEDLKLKTPSVRRHLAAKKVFDLLYMIPDIPFLQNHKFKVLDAVEKAEKQLNLTIGVFVSIVVSCAFYFFFVTAEAKKTDAAEPSNIQESNEKKKEDSEYTIAAPRRRNIVAIEVVGGGNFCIQLVAYQKEASIIQQKLASLKLQEAPTLGSFNPEKSDLLLAQFREDNSRYRAMEGQIYSLRFLKPSQTASSPHIEDVPQGVARSAKARFEVFYIDYGTPELDSNSCLRPWDYSVKKSSGLAHIRGLAHVKVPSWKERKLR
ncbi:hypothetical protein AgCh_013298 [Apium graveolens]